MPGRIRSVLALSCSAVALGCAPKQEPVHFECAFDIPGMAGAGSMTLSVEPRNSSDPAITVTIVRGQTIEAQGSVTPTEISASWASPQGAKIDLTVNPTDGSATLLGRNGEDVQTFEGSCETIDP